MPRKKKPKSTPLQRALESEASFKQQLSAKEEQELQALLAKAAKKKAKALEKADLFGGKSSFFTKEEGGLSSFFSGEPTADPISLRTPAANTPSILDEVLKGRPLPLSDPIVQKQASQEVLQLADEGSLPLAVKDERLLAKVGGGDVFDVADTSSVPGRAWANQAPGVEALVGDGAVGATGPMGEVKGNPNIFQGPPKATAAQEAAMAKEGTFFGKVKKALGGKVGEVGTLSRGAKIAGGAAMGLGLIDLLGRPAKNMVYGLEDMLPSVVDKRMERVLEGQQQARDFQRMRAERDKRMQVLQRKNTAMMAQYAPHLFNQLMAGRTLPRDATVIGGEPRADLVQEVATQMANGQFQMPQE